MKIVECPHCNSVATQPIGDKGHYCNCCNKSFNDSKQLTTEV